MTIAIDMVGTNLESGSKSYNINFCISLSKKIRTKNLYFFNKRLLVFNTK